MFFGGFCFGLLGLLGFGFLKEGTPIEVGMENVQEAFGSLAEFSVTFSDFFTGPFFKRRIHGECCVFALF